MGCPERPSLPSTEDDCSFLSPFKKSRFTFKCSSSHARLQLPEDLVAEILIRLPAKSVARFRCVSTTWLSIATDPSFILSHARRSRKSLLVRSLPTQNRQGYRFHNLLFSFSVSGFSCRQLIPHQMPDVARSSCNGLVLFWRVHEPNPPCEHYVMNPLTGLIIDIPDPSIGMGSMLELYYHRWTGEYRLLNIRFCEGTISSHLDAEVMSLAAARPSWRPIKAKAPFVSLFYSQSRVLVSYRLYWTCQQSSEDHSILVFDILKETFSLLELPLPSCAGNTFPSFADSSCSKFGLVEIEGNLCLWVVYRDKSCTDNVMIDIWASVEGDEKWVNTYSLCLADEWRWALYYPFNAHLLIDCCLCIIETELLFLFDGRRAQMKHTRQTELSVQYLFHWNLKSGKYSTEKLPEVFHVLMSPGIIHKESLIDAPFCRTAGIGALAHPTPRVLPEVKISSKELVVRKNTG